MTSVLASTEPGPVFVDRHAVALQAAGNLASDCGTVDGIRQHVDGLLHAQRRHVRQDDEAADASIRHRALGAFDARDLRRPAARRRTRRHDVRVLVGPRRGAGVRDLRQRRVRNAHDGSRIGDRDARRGDVEAAERIADDGAHVDRAAGGEARLRSAAAVRRVERLHAVDVDDGRAVQHDAAVVAGRRADGIHERRAARDVGRGLRDRDAKRRANGETSPPPGSGSRS